MPTIELPYKLTVAIKSIADSDESLAECYAELQSAGNGLFKFTKRPVDARSSTHYLLCSIEEVKTATGKAIDEDTKPNHIVMTCYAYYPYLAGFESFLSIFPEPLRYEVVSCERQAKKLNLQHESQTIGLAEITSQEKMIHFMADEQHWQQLQGLQRFIAVMVNPDSAEASSYTEQLRAFTELCAGIEFADDEGKIRSIPYGRAKIYLFMQSLTVNRQDLAGLSVFLQYYYPDVCIKTS